jgi:hypothetical protein
LEVDVDENNPGSPYGYFGPDHPVPSVRECKRLSKHTVLKVLAERAAWLHMKMKAKVACQEPAGLYSKELRALVIAAECVEASDLP